MTLRPLHDRVLVERIEEAEQVRGGIIIPDSAKEKPQEGKVIATGNGKRLEDGTVVALDAGHIDLAGRSGDTLLDTFIFAGDSSLVSDVWSAGRHVVKQGRHVAREAIKCAYGKATAQLMDVL